MTSDTNNLVKLITTDNHEVLVEKQVIIQSKLIRNMLDDLEVPELVVTLPEITLETIKIVLKYLELHKNDVISDVKVEKLLRDVEQRDVDLLKPPNITYTLLYEVIKAANFLDIHPLLDVSCRLVAIGIKGKNVHEMRQELEIPKEHWRSDEEIAQMEEEYKKLLEEAANETE